MNLIVILKNYIILLGFIIFSTRFDIGICKSNFPHFHSDFLNYDVTRPELKEENSNEISLRFIAFGKTFNRRLFENKNQRLHNLSVECHHYETSKDSLSICSSRIIHGYFDVDNDIFSFVPLNDSLNYIVYRRSDLKFQPICGNENFDLSTDYLRQKTIRKRSVVNDLPYTSNNVTRYIELFLSIHAPLKNFFVDGTKNFDKGKLEEHLSSLLFNANILFKQLNIMLVLTNYEVWDTFKSEVVDDSTKTLQSFNAYRQETINKNHYNDVAYLLVDKAFTGRVVGRASVDTICSDRNSAGIAYWNLDYQTAFTLAHEIGHNLGFTHDEQHDNCKTDVSIMAAKADASQSLHTTSWSTCSKEQLKDAYFRQTDVCLHNLPKWGLSANYCGNGILETGEECDCGSEKECINNTCCYAKNCTLTAGSTCYYGDCCLNCQHKPKYSVCRASKNNCDLPEMCSGDSAFCPSDVFKQIGYECSNNRYCYNGECVKSKKDQCLVLWNNADWSSSCEDTLIKYPFNFCGNWNYDTGKLNACTIENYKCSPLMCLHNQEKSLIMGPAYFLRKEPFVINNKKCVGFYSDVGRQAKDPGTVKFGSECGDGKFCNTDGLCTNQTAFLSTCDCNGMGVCNNLNQCHCDVGYEPPDCVKKGGGGSIHSNPIGGYDKPSKSNNAKIIGITVFMLIFLILLGIAIFFAIRKDLYHKLFDNILLNFNMPLRNKTPKQRFDATINRTKTHIGNPVLRQSSVKNVDKMPPIRPPPPQKSANNENTNGKCKPPIAPKPVLSAYQVAFQKNPKNDRVSVC